MDSLMPGLASSPNIHPMFVHFPIAFWIAAAAFLGFAVWKQREDVWKMGTWLFWMATATAVAAAVTGLMAANEIGHDAPGHGLVHVHRNFMYVATGLAIAVSAFAWLKRAETARGVRFAILGGALVVVGVTTLGADRGAELVFRYGIGSVGESPADVDHDHGHGDDTRDGHHDQDAGHHGRDPGHHDPAQPQTNESTETVPPPTEPQTETPSPEPEVETKTETETETGGHDHAGHEH
jgi:uncharacterized membrane protein